MSTAIATRLIKQAQERLTPGRRGAPPPPEKDVNAAVAAIAKERNGYLAWSLYVALQQGDVAIAPTNIEQLAGAMLNVDVVTHGDVAARRTLSLIDAERHAGRTPSNRLLAHGARASELQGLPDLAEALYNEAMARPGSDVGSREMVEMRASLIAACGGANQLERAFGEYHALAAQLRCDGDGPHDMRGPQPAIALLNACVAAGDLDAAFALLAQLREARYFQVRAGALVPLLRGCVRHDDAERAQAVLAMADEINIEVRAAAVREFARHGSPAFVALARELHRGAVRDGAPMPTGSTTKLVRACLSEGDDAGAAEVLAIPPSAADATVAELDRALDQLHSLSRQELQRERAAQDVRRRPGPDGGGSDG